MTPEEVRKQMDNTAPKKLFIELRKIYEKKAKSSNGIWSIFKNPKAKSISLSKQSAH